LYITFEHKPSWSKVSIDDEVPVQTAIDHIRAVLDPYKVEFGQIKSYTRWNGMFFSYSSSIPSPNFFFFFFFHKGTDQSSCEEYSFDSSYFFIGSSAQNVHPPGLFDTNTNLEQVQNLCWKLALSLRNNASPQLLGTFEVEARHKTEEVLLASSIFSNLIGDYYKTQEEGITSTNVNASHSRDLIYQLKRLQSCFVGDSAFSVNNNILNHADDEDVLLSLQNDPINASTPSFEFIAPPSASKDNLGMNTMAAAGCLAPNAKLKPYTLFQLLLMTSTQSANTITKPVVSQTLSSNLLSNAGLPAPLPPQQDDTGKSKREPSKKVLSTITSHNRSRQRSNSVTSSNNGSLSTIWSVIPILQKNINVSLKKRNTIISSSNSSSSSTTSSPIATATATTTNTPASALISNERWKSIKTNHLQLLDRVQSFKKYGLTFTLLVFCGSMQEANNDRLQSFTRKLGSPGSFLQRYENHSNGCNRHSFTSSSNTDHRSSMSSVNSTNRKSSFDNPRDSFDSYDAHTHHHRYSISSISSSSSIVYPPQQMATHTSNCTALFSILYITSSTKNEATKYLTNTPPAMVHSTFPHGLAHVFLDHDQQCYKSYGVQLPEVVIIRPDGYVGTRVSMQYEDCFERLNLYFDSFLRPAVDMNTAAATVAAGYDF
jgi:hypothetical protein